MFSTRYKSEPANTTTVMRYLNGFRTPSIGLLLLLVTSVIWVVLEAAAGGVLWKMVFLKISQNSQENACVGVSFLIKLQAAGLQLYSSRDSKTGGLL